MHPPIDSLPLFPILNEKLVSFLKSLSRQDWAQQTVAKQWVIKDVAAHLLDGNFRRIALHRDNWSAAPEKPIRSYHDLVDYLNGLNADWVKATRRLSPAILIELLESTNKSVYELFCTLDPYAPSAYPVSWAGEELSRNWFDIAREYTERWLHQQQIREALGNKEIMTEELYNPFLTIFMQAWPYTCRELDAPENTILKTTITGSGGGSWYLKRMNGTWTQLENLNNDTATPKAETIIEGEVAWKLFSKSLRRIDIDGKYEIKGDSNLGKKVLEMVSVMA